jgi:hypothetical protein
MGGWEKGRWGFFLKIGMGFGGLVRWKKEEIEDKLCRSIIWQKLRL